MFNLFNRKSEAKLRVKYEKLQKEVYYLSKENLSESKKKQEEANEIMIQISKLK